MMARSDVINGGYIGKILRVDLTKGKLQDEILDPDVLRKYVGGLGVAAKIMYDEVSPNIMPYDAENLVVFMTGPLTGTVAPGSSRYVVYTLNSFNPKVCSPGFGGGYWAFELKRSGYDGIIIQGKSSKPVFLWIHNGTAEIRDASALWGKDTHETEDQVQELLGGKVRVATIGPAGENLVRGSIISNDKRHVAAKAGDVLGSKRLKAIAVGGGKGKRIPVAHKEQAKQIAKLWRGNGFSKRRYNAGNLLNWGKPEYFGKVSPWLFWVKNLSDPEFGYEYGKAIWGIEENSKITPLPCYNCDIGCCYDCEIGTGPYKGKTVDLTGGAENYEGFAGNIGVTEPGTILYLTDFIDRIGLDARMGQAVAFVYEGYERGLLTREHTDGLELKWGNENAAIEIVKKIVKRRELVLSLKGVPKRQQKFLVREQEKT